MPLSPLTALSPLDGRYARSLEPLRSHFSELALIRHRVRVEIEWLLALGAEPAVVEVAPFAPAAAAKLRALADGFDERHGERVKAIERETNHDVKAIERWIREQVAGDPVLERASAFIHFACTSEDINNLAYALMVRGARDTVLLPAIDEVIGKLTGARARPRRPADARAHSWPAGDADDARQGARQLRPSAPARPRAARRGEAHREGERRGGRLQRASRRLPERRLGGARAAVRRVVRARVQPVHGADRAARRARGSAATRSRASTPC